MRNWISVNNPVDPKTARKVLELTDKIVNKLLNLSKNSKTYKNLYDILKLTTTTKK